MPDLSSALQECLEALRSGRNLPEALRRHPGDRDRLIELLRVANEVGQIRVPPPDAGFRLRARSALLGAAAVRRERQASTHGILGRIIRRPMRLAAALALALALLTGGLSAAAAESLPGEPLYGLKLGWEQLRLATTLDSTANVRLRLILADRRLNEAERVSSQGRSSEAVDLVTQFDAAMAHMNERVAAAPLKPVDAQELTRDLEMRQSRTDDRFRTVVENLTARGDSQAAAAVTRTQAQVDLSLKETKEALEAQRRQARPDDDRTKGDDKERDRDRKDEHDKKN